MALTPGRQTTRMQLASKVDTPVLACLSEDERRWHEQQATEAGKPPSHIVQVEVAVNCLKSIAVCIRLPNQGRCWENAFSSYSYC